LPPVGQQWRMIVLFAAGRKLNWEHAKLRQKTNLLHQKTCIDGSIMLPFLATLKIVYWQSMPAAQ
jgi:hypothetical protein